MAGGRPGATGQPLLSQGSVPCSKPRGRLRPARDSRHPERLGKTGVPFDTSLKLGGTLPRAINYFWRRHDLRPSDDLGGRSLPTLPVTVILGHRHLGPRFPAPVWTLTPSRLASSSSGLEGSLASGDATALGDSSRCGVVHSLSSG